MSATATASASLEGVRFSLTDLDPLDGITPWINFNDGVTSLIEFKTEIFGTDDPYTYFYGEQPFGSVSGDISTDYASVDSSVIGSVDSTFEIISMNAQGTAANGWSFTNRVHASGFPFGFTLSPQTAIRVEAQTATVNASVSGFDGEETVQTGATLEISALGNWSSRDSIVAYANNLTDEENVYKSYTNTVSKNNLAVVLSNTSTNTLEGELLVEAYVWGQSDASVVPEPDTWALMLLGLGSIVVASSGRSRQRA